MFDKLKSWWSDRTESRYGMVPLVSVETELLGGFIKVSRFRVYYTNDIDSITANTGYHTWRALRVGPIVVSWRYPRFIESKID